MFHNIVAAAPRLVSRKSCVFLAAFACLLLAATLPAVQSLSLPDFTVQALDGSSSKSSDWQLQGKWLVIYVEGRCDPCVGLLGRLNKQDYPQLASRTVIVVGGAQVQDVQALRSKLPDLATAAWYADSTKNAPAVLNLRSAPVIVGLQDRVVHWHLNGVPADRKFLHSALTTWLGQ
jgi:hypothetical protein